MKCIIRPSRSSLWDHLREMGVDLMGFRGFRQGIHGDKRRSERLSLLHKQFCSAQTEGREHPTHREGPTPSSAQKAAITVSNPRAWGILREKRAKWKSETESHKRRGRHSRKTASIDTRTGTKRTIKPRGISRIPHRRESDGIEREEPPFQFSSHYLYPNVTQQSIKYIAHRVIFAHHRFTCWRPEVHFCFASR